MASITTLKRQYYATAMSLTEAEAQKMSINDLEFLFFTSPPSGGGGGGGPIPSTDITDSTLAGRNMLTAATTAAQKTLLALAKADVGLANVDNTSDTGKPVSTAQQTALNLKANLASPAFTGTPTGITKTHVGLANADNTSDANKPVSTAQQTALNLKADTSAVTTALAGKANSTHSHAIADLPAGSVVSTISTTRPTARTDVVCIFLSAADPGANAFNDDIWVRV